MTKLERASLRMKRMDAVAYARARRDQPEGNIARPYHTELHRLRTKYPL